MHVSWATSVAPVEAVARVDAPGRQLSDERQVVRSVVAVPHATVNGRFHSRAVRQWRDQALEALLSAAWAASAAEANSPNAES